MARKVHQPSTTRRSTRSTPAKQTSTPPAPAARDEDKLSYAASSDDEDEDDEPLQTQKPDELDDIPEEDDDDAEETVNPEQPVEPSQPEPALEQQPHEEEATTLQQDAASPLVLHVAGRTLVPLQFAKPTTPESLQNVVDMTEYWIDRILMEPASSPAHYPNLKFFYGLAMTGSNADANFGRLHCRMTMAELVVTLHQEPLATWDRSTWQDAVFDELVSLTRKCMRMDATALLEFNQDLVEQEAPNPAQPVQKLKPRLRTILMLVRLHMALAPIRALLEAAMDRQLPVEASSETLQEIL